MRQYTAAELDRYMQQQNPDKTEEEREELVTNIMLKTTSWKVVKKTFNTKVGGRGGGWGGGANLTP